LNPAISKDCWTEKEKIKILELHQIYGNRWSKIAQHLEGRTDNAVKNFFYSNLRKKMRKFARNKAANRRKKYREKVKAENEASKQNEKIKSSDEGNPIISLENDASEILYSLSEPVVKKEEQIEEKMEIQNTMNKTLRTGNLTDGICVPACGSFFNMLPFIYSHHLYQYQLNQMMFMANTNQ
jgi:hypothetical protein